MLRRSYLVTAGAVLAAALFHAGTNPLRSQTPAPAALAGQVSSMEEGSMEGVLVSAKKAGSTITTTVVTNDRGNYSFPQGRLEPGQYALSIRAVGYEMDDAGRYRVSRRGKRRPRISSSTKPKISRLKSRMRNG